MEKEQGGLSVKNISDLVLKDIYSIYKTKNLTKEQIQKQEVTEWENFEKYTNLSENQLNTKMFMPKMMLWLLLLQNGRKYILFRINVCFFGCRNW